MNTKELIKNRKHLLNEYSHKYVDYDAFDHKKHDVTDTNDVLGFYDLTEQEQVTLVNYCLIAFKPIQTINHNHSSYGLKHMFEDYIDGFYTYSGQFKAGMLLAGFLPEDKNEFDWHFAISENSTGIDMHNNQIYQSRYFIPVTQS